MSRVPRIRFIGFEEDWEQRKLGEIVGIYDGVHQTPKYQDNGIMFLSVENIATLQSTKYISEDNFKRDYKVYPQENDILMTRIGDVGTTNVIADKGLKAYYVSLALLKYKSTNPYFLSNAIQSEYVKKELANRTLKTAIPMKINKDEIGKVDVMLPISVQEQNKIGEYFRNIDHLITLHQRKLEKLKIIKKSMLENLFPQNGEKTPKIRFSGFTEDWEQRKLGEMVEFYNGDRSSRYPNDSDMVFDGIPFINAGDLVLGRVKLDTTNKITEEKYNQLSGAKIQCGDIIYCLRGTLGKNAFVDNFDIGTIASSLVDIRPQKIVGKYLFQVLNSDIEYSQRILNDEGAAQPNLSAKNLYLFDIPIPRDAEQIKIAEYLELLDHLITLHQSKLEKLQKIKKSMLESMFV